MSYIPKSDFLKIMIERGFVSECTDYEGLDSTILKGNIAAYIGFDATAKSLHVGSLIQIMMLRWLQKTGGQPITLMGGGTTKVGDPSFRAEERPLLGETQIEDNISGIKKVFSEYLNYGDKSDDALMINNDEWLSDLNYLEFLRDVGRHFSVNRMLSFESVKSRLDREQSLSFLEFNYMILQAYDFYELNKRYKCKLQMGGSDQLGNIINGMELTRRISDERVFGLTSPLLTTSDGKKMGKSQDGAIWLNSEKFSPYNYYQFWRNTHDSDVIRFLYLFTDISKNEIEKYRNISGVEINEIKKILAFEAVKLCHGKEIAREVSNTARKLFEEGLCINTLPTIEIENNILTKGISLLQLLKNLKISNSNSSIRRLIQGGAIKINNKKILDERKIFTLLDIKENGFMKISLGKKHHFLIKSKNI